jgi:hypothetical protein
MTGLAGDALIGVRGGEEAVIGEGLERRMADRAAVIEGGGYGMECIGDAF